MPVSPRKRRPKGAGSVRQLPSRRWQASVVGPDGVRHAAPQTFDTKLDANAWLAGQVEDLEVGTWAPPRKVRAGTLESYSEDWLATRDLKPRTRAEYRGLLDRRILPDLGDVSVDRLTPAVVRSWFAAQGDDRPTDTAKAYGLLHAICATAVEDDILQANPCRIRGAALSKRRRRITPATPAEIDAIADAIPEAYRLLILLAAWCGPRSGELRELRRADVDVAARMLTVERAVGYVPGEGYDIGDPKSEAGIRRVAIPKHILPAVVDHLKRFTGPEPDALLFPAVGKPGKTLAVSTLYGMFYPAREAAGRPDLRLHDLRHTGAVLATTRGGATLKETMARLGHSSPSAALMYQHASDERAHEIADALSDYALAEAKSRRKA